MNMRADDVIWNPLTGEKALFVETVRTMVGIPSVVLPLVLRNRAVPEANHTPRDDRCSSTPSVS